MATVQAFKLDVGSGSSGPTFAYGTYWKASCTITAGTPERLEQYCISTTPGSGCNRVVARRCAGWRPHEALLARNCRTWAILPVRCLPGQGGLLYASSPAAPAPPPVLLRAPPGWAVSHHNGWAGGTGAGLLVTLLAFCLSTRARSGSPVVSIICFIASTTLGLEASTSVGILNRGCAAPAVLLSGCGDAD